MGTKLNPGKFDCYRDAKPDEPLFILRAKDPVSDHLVRTWAALRSADLAGAYECIEMAFRSLLDSDKVILQKESEKYAEAIQLASEIVVWRKANCPPAEKVAGKKVQGSGA